MQTSHDNPTRTYNPCCDDGVKKNVGKRKDTEPLFIARPEYMKS